MSTKYNVRMVRSGDGRCATQTHHLELDAPGAEPRFACGVSAGLGEKSYKSLVGWLKDAGHFGTCRRCAKSQAARALRHQMASALDAVSAAAARARLDEEMNRQHTAALEEDLRVTALRDAEAVLNGLRLTPWQLEKIAVAVQVCGLATVAKVHARVGAYERDMEGAC